MRKLTLTLSLAAAAAVVAPLGSAEAQWDVLRRRTETGTVIRGDSRDVYDDRVYDRDGRASRVPPGHMPPRGMCRVWIDGVPPGRQPRATDCSTAQREAYRYGSRARVIYGGDTYGRNDRRTRTYETTIDGRRCRVTERADGTRRTVCDDRRYDDRRYESNRGVWGSNRVYESNGRYDDDSDRRVKTKKVKIKEKRGKGHDKH